MKKDYMQVTETETVLSETAFIDQFWTGIWEASQPAFLASTLEEREAYRLMKPILETLPPNSRLLDGGCGLGEWTLYFASKGFDAVGLDLSQATITRLKELFPERVFLAGDIRKLGFEDNSFDLYFSWGTFEHFENGFGEPLREAWRILKPGGYLFITIPFQNRRHQRRDRRELQFWDENFDPLEGYRSKMRFYQWRLTQPELRREFEIHGFKTLGITPIDQWHGIYRLLELDYRIDTRSKFGRWLHSTLVDWLPVNYAAHMLMGVAQKPI